MSMQVLRDQESRADDEAERLMKIGLVEEVEHFEEEERVEALTEEDVRIEAGRKEDDQGCVNEEKEAKRLKIDRKSCGKVCNTVLELDVPLVGNGRKKDCFRNNVQQDSTLSHCRKLANLWEKGYK